MKKTLNDKGLYLFFPTDAEHIEESIGELKQLLLEQITNNIRSGLWGQIYPEFIKLLKMKDDVLQSTATNHGKDEML